MIAYLSVFLGDGEHLVAWEFQPENASDELMALIVV
jgi:hypothetical protein